MIKHKERGKKKVNDEEPTPEEKLQNETKIPYNDNLARKLINASTPLSYYVIKDGFRDNSKVNPTSKIVYIICNHQTRMPVRYRTKDHKLDKGLSMFWEVKCDDCKKAIAEYKVQQISHEMDVQLPEPVETIPLTPQQSGTIATSDQLTPTTSKVNFVFENLEEVIKIQLDRVKTRILLVAEQEDKDPFELLINNSEAFGANIGKLFTKCINSLGQQLEEDLEVNENLES